MKLNITHSNRGCGSHSTIVEEPYASALKNIDGLATATNNATYRGVKFGRQRQKELTIYFKPHTFLPWVDWEIIREKGCGVAEIPEAKLAEIFEASARIDDVIARAVPARPTYVCAGHADGCCNRVSDDGDFCQSCEHDNF